MERFPLWRLSRKSMEIYSRLESVLGATLISQVLDFYSVFRTIAEGYADRARKNQALLREAERTHICVITLPSKAESDAAYFHSELQERGFATERLFINRVWSPLAVEPGKDDDPLLSETIQWYQQLATTHQSVVAGVTDRHGDDYGKIQSLRELPGESRGLEMVRGVAKQVKL